MQNIKIQRIAAITQNHTITQVMTNAQNTII